MGNILGCFAIVIMVLAFVVITNLDEIKDFIVSIIKAIKE